MFFIIVVSLCGSPIDYTVINIDTGERKDNVKEFNIMDIPEEESIKFIIKPIEGIYCT